MTNELESIVLLDNYRRTACYMDVSDYPDVLAQHPFGENLLVFLRCSPDVFVAKMHKAGYKCTPYIQGVK